MTEIDRTRSVRILSAYQAVMGVNLLILLYCLISPRMWVSRDGNITLGLLSRYVTFSNQTHNSTIEPLNLITARAYHIGSMIMDLISILFALVLNFTGSREFRSKWDYLFMLLPMISWTLLVFCVHHMSNAFDRINVSGGPGHTFYVLLGSQVPIMFCGFLSAYITVQVMHDHTNNVKSMSEVDVEYEDYDTSQNVSEMTV